MKRLFLSATVSRRSTAGALFVPLMIAIFSFLSVTPVISDNGPKSESLKVGVVNIREVFKSYERADSVRKEIVQKKKEAEDKLKKIKEKSAQIKQELKELEKMSELWKKRAKKYYELQAQQELMKDFWKGDQQQMLGEMSAQIYQDIQDTISSYGKKHDFDLILKTDTLEGAKNDPKSITSKISNRSVLYFRNRMDITDKIISILNESYQPESNSGTEKGSSGK